MRACWVLYKYNGHLKNDSQQQHLNYAFICVKHMPYAVKTASMTPLVIILGVFCSLIPPSFSHSRFTDVES